MPRVENRVAYNITDADFSGYDRWNCYECSFLYAKGAPHYLGLIITYPSNSWAIVESKSLKLYLNSFNMTNMGPSFKLAIENFIATVKKDLEELLKTNVQVDPFNVGDHITRIGGGELFLEDLVCPDKIEFNHFKEAPEILEGGGYPGYDVYSKLLRSNCKVTHQPDCGVIYVAWNGIDGPKLESLLKYIVSFRDENHFHEEVCEMVYKRLKEKFNPNFLMVQCYYTRRGGIDINPFRVSGPSYNWPVFADQVCKTIFQ